MGSSTRTLLRYALALAVLAAPGVRAGEPETKAEDLAQKLQLQINYHLDLADVHRRYGENTAGKDALQQIFKLGADPKNTSVLKAHLVLGMILQKEEKWQDAIKEFESIQSLLTQPDDQVVVAVLISQSYEKLKELPKAEAALMTLTGSKVTQGVRQEGWKRLVEFWRAHREQLDASTKDLDAAVAKDPKDADVLERLAVIFTDITPDLKKAETYTEKLSEVCAGSKDTDARLRLAGLYERQKAYEKALKVYQALIPDVPKAASWDVEVRCAIMMVYAGKKDEAVKKVEKELVPKAQTALEQVGLAGFYASAAMPLKAEEAFVKAASISQTPEDVTACMIAAAESCRQRKDYDKAEEFLRAALKQYRDNRPIRTRVNEALIALYKEQGKLGDLHLEQ
ncbi:MAG: tetratricopeptide repeat protein [Planctomycetota bacterium]